MSLPDTTGLDFAHWRTGVFANLEANGTIASSSLDYAHWSVGPWVGFTPGVTGALAATLGTASVSGTGTVLITGILSATLGNVTLSSGGNAIVMVNLFLDIDTETGRTANFTVSEATATFTVTNGTSSFSVSETT